MNIVLLGTGQMGQAVERLAVERGHSIVARFDENHTLPDTDSREGAGTPTADVAIDFTLPGVAAGHIHRCCVWGLPVVVGTTGWYERLKEVKGWVDAFETAVLYAPNFSLGVAVLVKALRSIVPVLEALPEYDAYIHELHHVRKVDSPSGTAMLLADVLQSGLTRKTHIETETRHQRIDPAALHVTSTRIGNVIGKHTVGLDSPFDTLELMHEAKNRTGFAFGAVRAAEWLVGRRGLFTLDDVLDDWLR